jgi:hypothetical protein
MKVLITLTKDGTSGSLSINGREFKVSNRVRSFAEGTREAWEVINSIPSNLPYDPQHFPAGLWLITNIIRHKVEKGKENFKEHTYGPVKIVTNARQNVHVWKLDDNGDYESETSQMVNDTGYLLHYSDSSTTYGCVRLASPDDALAIAGMIEPALKADERVTLEVSYGS